MKTLEKYCYICKTPHIFKHQAINDFSIFKCSECGLLWVPDINEETINRFYDENYFKNKSNMGYRDYLEDEANHRKNAQQILKKINAFCDLESKEILDIGCAFGFLLDEARKTFGCKVNGVELSSHACNYGRQTLDLDIINSPFDKSLYKNRQFDVIFLLGTIEHLISPHEMLSNIQKKLRSEGLIIITTINTKGILPFYSLKPPEHLFYFNHNNLKKMLLRSNFEVVLNKTYFVNYNIHDLFHRLGEFSNIALLKYFSKLLSKISLRARIPTNEMIVIARKIGA